MSVTFMSSITIIGYPTKSYMFGSIILWYSVYGIIPSIVACIYYIPLTHRLRLLSIYEVIYACHAHYIHFRMNFSSNCIFCKNDTASLILGCFVLYSTWSDASTKESAIWNLLYRSSPW